MEVPANAATELRHIDLRDVTLLKRLGLRQLGHCGGGDGDRRSTVSHHSGRPSSLICYNRNSVLRYRTMKRTLFIAVSAELHRPKSFEEH